MNNKLKDESDVSASVAGPAEYIPYFSLTLDHLALTSIDANAAIITAICCPILRVLKLYNSEITTTSSI